MTTDTGPSRSIEVERKYDAARECELPVWTTLPGVEAVDTPQSRALDAVYYDTPDRALARAGVAVRRRTGGHDEGWHIKGPRQGDSRLELGWPLDGDDVMPLGVREALTQWTEDALAPIARIQNNRVAYSLRGAHGEIAEFVDDDVQATDFSTGARRAWREWELELGAAAPTDSLGRAQLFAAADRAVFLAGGRPSTSGSKLARALGV